MKQDLAPWGVLTSLDIYDCDPKIIRDDNHIKRYVIELCDLIKMKRFGECQIEHFGNDDRVAGYSMCQLIETSLISGHFAEFSNSAYIDIFSCKSYDSEKVAAFSQTFFIASSIRIHVTERV